MFNKMKNVKKNSVVKRKAGGKATVKSITPKKVVLEFPNKRTMEVTWEHLKEHYKL